MTIARRAFALLMVAFTYGAGAASAASGPTPPVAGLWHIPRSGGGFTVSPSQTSISGLLIRHPGCGKGTMSVPGTLHLSIASRGGVSNWIIGRNTPSTSSGISPIGVRVKQGGKSQAGSLSFIFAVGGFARDNIGDLVVGGCTVEFDASH